MGHIARLVLLSIVVGTVSGTAAAQMEGAAGVPNAEIAPQPLEQALHEVYRRTGLQIMYLSELAEGRQSLGAPAGLPPMETLSRVLEGTGLTYRLLDNRAVSIRAEREPAPTVRRLAAEVQSSNDRRTAQSDSTQIAAATEREPENKRPNGLEEVVVSAQKRDEQLRKVPISISVQSGLELEGPTISSVTDALNTIPGVAANQAYAGAGTMVSIRGVATGISTFSGASPVAYYLDSVPFGLVKSAIAPDQNVYDLQRIEVLRGPQGTLYGASALNGVVRVLTNDADLNNFDLKVRGSNSYTESGRGNYRADLAVNVPLIDGKLAMRGVVGYASDSGWIDTPVTNDSNSDVLRNYRLKINAQPTDDLAIGLSAWSTRDAYDAPPNAGDDQRNASLLDQPIETDFDTYSLKAAYDFSGYTLSSMTSYLQYSNSANLDFASLLGFPFAIYIDIDSQVFSEELLLNSPTSGLWRWSVGAIYRRGREDRFQYDSVRPLGESFFVSVTDESKSYAGFAEFTRRFLNGRVEGTVGLRYFEDRVTQSGRTQLQGPSIPSDGDYDATTPRAVLTWHANSDLSLYVSYS